MGHSDGVEVKGNLCIGREAEREAFKGLTDERTVQGLFLCTLRGLGGIGKSTLASTFAEDFIALPNTSAISVNCVTLASSDMASLMRLVGRASASEAGDRLAEAAADLDRVGSIVRTSPAPQDVDEAQVAAWYSARQSALEFLGFFTAAALETAVLSQPTSSASSAVIAGFRAAMAAAAPARAALGTFAQELRQAGQLPPSTEAIFDDPEAAAIDAWASFMSSETRRGPLCIVIDKAENLASQLYRITEILAVAAAKAETQVVLILSGRLTRIPAPDGSALTCDEFISTTAVVGLDVDLRPLNPSHISDLFSATHLRMHPGVEDSRPPEWLGRQIFAITGGLPLWAALLSESICSAGPRIWEDETKANFVLGLANKEPLAELVARIFRGIELRSGTSAFPLLMLLAISPEEMDPSKALDAVGASLEDLEILDSHSFMSGRRLHDSARALLREYFLRSPALAAEIRSIALHLQEMLDRPGQSALEGHGSWTPYICDTVELAFWADREAGAWLALDYLCQGLPGWAPWIGPLQMVVGRFSDTLPARSDARVALRTLARVTYPALLGHILTRDLATSLASSTRKEALSSGYGTAASVGALGRYLEIALRLLVENSSEVSPEALACVEAEHLYWLTYSGFQDEAIELASELRGRVAGAPIHAPVRERFGDSLRRLINTQLRWCADDPSQAARSTESLFSLLRILVEVYPLGAPKATHASIKVIGPISQLRAFADALLERKELLSSSSDFTADLGDLLIELERYSVAAKMMRRAVALAPEWIRGREVLCRAALADGDHHLVMQVTQDVLEHHSREDGSLAPQLSQFGAKQLHLVCRWAVISANLARETSWAEEPRKHISDLDYAILFVDLLTGKLESAKRLLASSVDAVSATDYLAELAVLKGAEGSYESAASLLEEWREQGRSPFYGVLELHLLEAAVQRGWIPSQALSRAGASDSELQND